MRPLKTIWNILTTILVIIVILIAVALAGVRLVGLDPYVVLSGSMEPTYKTGSIVYVKEVDHKTLKTGDPITFMLDENTVATHRIVDIITDENDSENISYKTKGDNNDDVDGKPVNYKNIIGMPLFSLPYLGYIANYIQHPPGTYIVIIAIAALLLMIFLPDLLKKEK